jgi:predicted Zn-dependent protease
MTSQDDNIQDRLKEFLGKLPENFSVMEEVVDVDIQMDYFKKAKQLNRKLSDKELELKINELFDNQIDIETKRNNLILIAGSDTPQAFRAIEKLKNQTEKNSDLYGWVCMAYYENKTNLESSLLEQNQVFISTGLVGKGKTLR